MVRSSSPWYAGLLVAFLSLIVPPTVGLAHGAHDARGVARYQHIFEIVMENHSYDEIIGNSNAPAINALAQQYGSATNYYGVTHPSEPNYLALIAGSYFGIQDDAPPTATNHLINAPTLADQLEARGLTWKSYQQTMPYAGYAAPSYPAPSMALYAVKHNPFPFFTHIYSNTAEMQKNVPGEQLFADLATGDVPTFSFIAPDQCHDMHGLKSLCPDDTFLIQQGDAYVSTVVQTIMHSRTWQHGNNAIVVVWDENDFSATGVTGCCGANPGGGHVASIVITNHGPRGLQDGTPYNHYSLLRTVEDAFGLGCLQNSCTVQPMTPLFAVGDDEESR